MEDKTAEKVEGNIRERARELWSVSLLLCEEYEETKVVES